jgi:hypothetical protein
VTPKIADMASAAEISFGGCLSEGSDRGGGCSTTPLHRHCLSTTSAIDNKGGHEARLFKRL